MGIVEGDEVVVVWVYGNVLGDGVVELFEFVLELFIVVLGDVDWFVG